MSFLNFLGDLKGYIPSLGDIAKTLLFGGLFEDVIPKNDRFFAAPEGEERNKNWYEDDTKGALIYPQDLFEPGNEAYVLFFMRDPVYRDKKLLKRIALYMPPDIKVQYGAKWDENDMLLSTSQLKGLRGDAVKAVGALGTLSPDSVMNMKLEDFKNFGKVASEVLGTAAGRAAGKAIQGNEIGQVTSAVAGVTVNPMTGLLFDTVNLRNFTLNFELLARTKDESVMIRDIINTFKYGMHPGKIDASTEFTTLNNAVRASFLDYPKSFDIYFLTPSDKYLFNVQRSVLTDVSVNYNGSGVSTFFKDTGAPVDVRLSLTFKETELLTRDRVVDGY